MVIEFIVRFVECLAIGWFFAAIVLPALCESTCRDCGAPLMRGTLCGSYECQRRRLLRRLELMLVEGDSEELDEMLFCIEPAVKVMGD